MASWFSSFLKKKLLGKDNNLISLDEPYEVMHRLLKQCSVTGIIDAGASDGRVSKRLLRKFPSAHVYAFEPSSVYTEKLQQYARQECRFHPQFVALSDREGSADLYVTASPGSTSLLRPGQGLKEIDPQGSSIKRLEKVRLVTIDEWAKRNGVPSIQLMKFDIQAEELKALHGAVGVLERSTLLVYTEIWFNSVYNGGAVYSEIDLFLRNHGFVLYDIFKPKYNSKGLIAWANAIFLNARRFGM